MGFGRNETNLDYVFLVKSLVDLDKIPSYRFSVECKLASMIPNVKVKFRVIIFGYGAKTVTRNFHPVCVLVHRGIP